MRPLAVLGCSSDAGKSLVATALCRWFARRGVSVAPFKAQNMSNNARVVATPAGGFGEIGVAQWLQARAAGVEPDVRMNPVLVKPEADTRSQVVVLGEVDRSISTMAWDDRHDLLWEAMATSFDALRADHDLVLIEGAGSPAEINLRDQVNNRMVEHADASCLLVADIERGGAFAHLAGTWSLVPDTTRDRLAAFLLNRFRGDAALLAPGPATLTGLTGMADAGVLPMLDHDLPAEEGARTSRHRPTDAPRVVLPRLPFGSNLDEFHLLDQACDVVWADSPTPFDQLVAGRDVVVLPGSKHVVADLDWMRRRGIAGAVVAASGRGVRVVGVCGGAMMLGERIVDEYGVEGEGPAAVDGLGLVDRSTRMAAAKRVERVEVEAFGGVFGGYEIRYGELSDGVRFAVDGEVISTTVHGLFEHPAVVDAVFGVRVEPVLDRTFELLADAIDDHLDTALLESMVAG